MVNLYTININILPDPKDIQTKLSIFPKERIDKMQRLSLAIKRKQALASAILLYKVLSDHSLSFDNIYYGPNNKPLCEGLYFNISHSKDMVIIAVSDYNLGCDIELIDSDITTEKNHKLSNRFFHKKEAAFLEEVSSDQSSLAYNFYRIWTIKESYVKMTGTGLTTPLDSYAVNLKDSDVQILMDGVSIPCSVMETELDDYHISVCHEGPKLDCNIESLCSFVSHFLSGND